MMINSILSAQGIDATKVLGISVTHYSGNWTTFTFGMYDNIMYLFSSTGTASSNATLRVVYYT